MSNTEVPEIEPRSPHGCDDKAHLLELEEELNKLRAVFHNTPDPYGVLQSRRDALERDIALYHITPALIQHFPSELLLKIFRSCSDFPITLPPKADEPLLLLTQVSRSWRELTLQSPELWASISVNFAQEGTDVQAVTRISEKWLARTGPTYQLSITAACTGKFAELTCEDPLRVSSFMLLVISHAHRLKHLELAFPFTALHPLLHLPCGSLPYLEVLNLQPLLRCVDLGLTERHKESCNWPINAPAFRSLPSIREITFQMNPLSNISGLEEFFERTIDSMMEPSSSGAAATPPPFTPSLSLPWSQLTTMRFLAMKLTPYMWCSILAHCPKLEECWLGLLSPIGHPTQYAGDLYLEQLYHLHIATTGDLDEFLTCIVTPQLKTLALWCDTIRPSCISDFQAKSNFALDYFLPISGHFSDDIEPLLQQLPSVKALGRISSLDDIPLSVWEQVGRADLCPNLVALIIQPTATAVPSLVNMIASRWKATSGAADGISPFVAFVNTRPADLEAVNEELKRLEPYAEVDPNCIVRVLEDVSLLASL
ncbi:hypothetical protein C8J57DRAFT_1273112 [Mycena rebaudengoi]|nr:hypothetical protein C8J57DRAFT_1273112 [Mycena rebaudengoi]